MGIFGALKKRAIAKKADMGKAMASGGGNASALGQSIGGLLKKKKKPLVAGPSPSVMKKY